MGAERVHWAAMAVALVACTSSQDTASPPPRELPSVPTGPPALRGRVIAPAGADFDGLAVFLGPRMDASAMFWPEASAPVDPSGRFVLEPLEPGHGYVVLAEADLFEGFQSARGDGIVVGSWVLGEVDVPERGTLEREFPLLDDFPAVVRIRVRLDGSEPSPLIVRVLSENGGFPTYGGRLDAGEELRERVPRGSYRVLVCDPDAGWDHEQGELFVAESGATPTLDVPIRLARGSVRLVDATSGEPLADRTVLVGRAKPIETSVQAVARVRRTDATGRLELLLPPTTYVLELDPADPLLSNIRAAGYDIEAPRADRYVVLGWSEHGPSESELRL